jgi:hypothetical protein
MEVDWHQRRNNTAGVQRQRNRDLPTVMVQITLESCALCLRVWLA